MASAQTMDTTSRAPDEQVSMAARCEQLQALVGELLQTNQELRFKVETLERQAENMGRGLAATQVSAAWLLP
jgi:hypothetical protein